MSFHDVRFPAPVSFGSAGGPERRTDIVTLGSGREERNTPWAASRRRYDAGVGLRSLDDLHAVIAFFEARRGRLYAFRWRDPLDFKSCPPLQAVSPLDQQIGTGDGVATGFQLVKTYWDAAGSYERRITRPVAASVTVAINEVALGPGDFSVDDATGMVAIPDGVADGAIVTAGFAFDVPVRFDTDRLDVELSSFDAAEIPSIPVIEVRE